MKNRKRGIALLLLFALAPCYASDDSTRDPSAADSYARIERMRGDARAGSGADADPAQLAHAAAELESALAYLDTPAVRERAGGSKRLYFHGYDARRELAKIYARLGRNEQALATLADAQRFIWLPAYGAAIANDDAFAALKAAPRFQAVVATAAIPQNLFGGAAMATPYRDQLSVEERVAGLSLFWAEAKQNFVHFEQVAQLQWDQVYLEYLSKVIAAPTTRDYYRVLMQLAPLLRDGHTDVTPPWQLADDFYARPPIRAAVVQGKVWVDAVDSPILARRVRHGEEIVAIDGLPVKQYAEQYIAPFISASTPQNHSLRMYSQQLFNGAANRPLTLRLRGSDGAEREESVARAGYTDVQAGPLFAFKILPGDVAYFSLDNFESEESVKAFERALPRILAARALIIDVRRNGGGSGQHANEILSYLSRKAITGALSYHRAGEALLRAYGHKVINWVPLADPTWSSQINRAQIFTGPVTVLTGPQTASAAEDFVLAFNNLKRGNTIGAATAGSTGLPLKFSLPGGGEARICIKLDLYPDGRSLVGKGIAPHIEMQDSLADFQAGRDAVLERAASALRR